MVRRLFDRRVLLVTGKGGVGKTTIAVGLALAARDRGLQVLLVQLSKVDNIGPIFGLSLPEYKETKIEPNLKAITIEPYLALHEYLVKSVRIRTVVDWFLENRAIQYLTQAAPGWRELITVGKIWQLEQMTVGYNKRPKYDLIVVDAPATGHGLSFLRVPQIILNTLKFGPVRQHTREVQKMLLDPARTLLIGVTIPEEMAVNEVVDIYQAARRSLHIHYGATILNFFRRPVVDKSTRPYMRKLLKDKQAMASVGRSVPGGIKPLLEAMETQEKRTEMSRYYEQELEQRIPSGIIKVPFLPELGLERESLEKVAKVLAEQVEGGRQ